MWMEEKGKWMRTSMPTEKHNKRKKMKEKNNPDQQKLFTKKFLTFVILGRYLPSRIEPTPRSLTSGLAIRVRRRQKKWSPVPASWRTTGRLGPGHTSGRTAWKWALAHSRGNTSGRITARGLSK